MNNIYPQERSMKRMSFINKKRSCLSLCILASSMHLNCIPARQNALEALELAHLLKPEENLQQKMQEAFRKARQVVEQEADKGMDVFYATEKAAREELAQLFDQSKPIPKQTSNATPPSTPESHEKKQSPKSNPNLQIKLLTVRFGQQNKLTYQEAQNFVKNFPLLTTKDQLNTEKNKTLYNALKNWLKNNEEEEEEEKVFSTEDLETFEENNNTQPQPSHDSPKQNSAPDLIETI